MSRDDLMTTTSSAAPLHGAGSGRQSARNEDGLQAQSRRTARAGHDPTPHQRWPLKVVAVLAAAIFGVGLLWFHNGAESLVGVHQVASVGLQQRTHGLEALDMYLVPAAGTTAGGAATSWGLAGALIVTNGTHDQLLSVSIDGRPAVITTPPGAPGAITVTAARLTDLGFTARDPQVTVDDPAIQAGSVVPVTLTFAHRGDVHVSTPVITSPSGPDPVVRTLDTGGR
ncbi:hypothetical protein [Georgenia sp. SYP-B2076]|uniref:hypothetical protein n=1 Tax=Georgenia sp. SYP-B2076 TaxID=2495881 RepID=UPI000F8EC9F5|nr:hypothetical protein [Georgenia sp. SYP-B2076]